MKKIMVMMAMAAAVAAVQAAQLTLADARAKIDQAVLSSETMNALMKQLSAADQVAFLADVNKAISEMPGSIEERAAMFLNANSAAVRAAAPGNSATLIAETFATVSPESLPVIVERFSADLLNRSADPSVTYTDAQFADAMKNVMEKVNERCEQTDNGSARAGFAIAMCVLASNGEPADLGDTLIETLKHEDAKEMAKTEWIPAATAKDATQRSFEALLASADAGRRPDYAAVFVIAGPQYGTAVVADLTGKNAESDMFAQTKTPILDAVENVLVNQAPNAGADKPGDAAATGGAIAGAAIEAGLIGGGKTDTRPTPENPDPLNTGHSPIPYHGQNFGN